MKKNVFAGIWTLFCLTVFWGFMADSLSAATAPVLKDILYTTSQSGEEQVVFRLNAPVIPKIFALKGERPRVVFDFPATRPAASLKNRIKTDGRYIRQIRIGIHTGKDAKTRVVFDLAKDDAVDFRQHFDQQTNSLTVVVFSAAQGEKSAASSTKQRQAQQTEATNKAVITQADATVAKTQEKRQQDRAAATQPPPPARTPETGQAASSPKNSDSTAKATTRDNGPQAGASPAQAVKEKTRPEPGSQNVSAKKTPGPVLHAINFDNSSNRGEMIQFQLNDFYPPVVFGIEEGMPRVVCDFNDAQADKSLPRQIQPDGRYVKNIRIGQHTNPDKIRVVIDLAPDNSYDLQQVFFKEDNLFVLIINTM